MFQIEQVVLDANILPLSVYFEPEEIAAACISIASLIFNKSIPKFLAHNYTETIKSINSGLFNNKKTGSEILLKYFEYEKLIDFDIESFNFDENDKQPFWFDILIQSSN